MKTLLHAAYVFPVTAPLLRDGGLVIEQGSITAIGGYTPLRQLHPDATVIDLGNALLTPGLVNPHTHLELSNCACGPSPEGSFADWILSLPRRLGRDRGLTPDEIFPPATKAGISQSLRFGVTTVGDISQQVQFTRPILAESPLRCVSYGETLGLALLRPRFEELLPQAIDTRHGSDRLRIALTPHAPYTVDLPGYRQCLTVAQEQDLPLATHLSETLDEHEFLTRQTGPFRRIWDTLGLWSEPVETHPDTPIRFAHAIGLLQHPTLLAHVNYCTDDELSLLAAGRASVVYCPRTHAYFGHPPHRFRDMIDRGINVAVGTDSCASSPDLNPLADLRLLHTLDPSLPPEFLLQLITLNAARALHMDDQVGSLAPGKWADIAAFPVTTADPLRELLDTDVTPSRLWIGGTEVPIPSDAPR